MLRRGGGLNRLGKFINRDLVNSPIDRLHGFVARFGMLTTNRFSDVKDFFLSVSESPSIGSIIIG
jgi:hypothetical protein